MKIATKVSAEITFTKEEEKTIANFLQIKKEYRDICGGTLKRSCDDCPFYHLCDAGISSVEDFKEALETNEE